MLVYDLHSVRYRYALDRQAVEALRGVDLEVRKGEFIALAGPSGSGKTTLLNLLGLLEQAQQGEVIFEGANVSRLPEHQRMFIRRKRIGYVFQTFHLIPTLTAYENVEYFVMKEKITRSEMRKRVCEALAAVGIVAQAHRWPHAMSGGQRQRVAIARALVRQPEVVLADEPTAALDQATGMAVIDLMKGLNRERGTTFLFSTHDPQIIAAADRVVHLTDGRIAT